MTLETDSFESKLARVLEERSPEWTSTSYFVRRFKTAAVSSHMSRVRRILRAQGKTVAHMRRDDGGKQTHWYRIEDAV